MVQTIDPPVCQVCGKGPFCNGCSLGNPSAPLLFPASLPAFVTVTVPDGEQAFLDLCRYNVWDSMEILESLDGKRHKFLRPVAPWLYAKLAKTAIRTKFTMDDYVVICDKDTVSRVSIALRPRSRKLCMETGVVADILLRLT